jgi:NADH-ubiquinone oxidoreductase chain 1
MSLIMPLRVLWFVTCLAETNRRPFDFAEGESELVSGFNVEYGSGGFALIFIAEYLNIIGIRIVTRVLLFFTVKIVFISDFILLVEIIIVSVVFI